MYSVFITIIIGIAFQSVASAQNSNDTQRIKKYINSTVQAVENEQDVIQKRVLLNESFDKIITVLDKVSERNIPENDAKAIILLRANILEKRNELNGEQGFKRVEDFNLNYFSQYVQDDFEQASGTIVIGVTTALLIALILLML